ncbi:hypothetical protein VEx25_0085 [Vibrio antiquarius]|uniref:Uncharacterized protein n=1 Tax=Vibrio antiquarius (strain Ex25) TaxID=150340 RepID=A0ABM9WWN0_VIBAE|nr:hypothetical protein VEx25_0085 [Vibrio antiquarius]
MKTCLLKKTTTKRKLSHRKCLSFPVQRLRHLLCLFFRKMVTPLMTGGESSEKKVDKSCY